MGFPIHFAPTGIGLNAFTIIMGDIGPFSGQKGLKLVNSRDQKCKITNVQLNRSIDVPKLPRQVYKVDM